MHDAQRPAGADDILVVGAGAVGLCCAYQLLREGRAVTVLEQSRVGAGSSHGNCGTVTPSLLPLPSPDTMRHAVRWLLQRDAPLYVKPWPPTRWPWLLSFARHCTSAEFARILSVKAPLLLASRKLLGQWVREIPLDCEFIEQGHLSVYRDLREWEKARRLVRVWQDAGIATQVLEPAAARALEPCLSPAVVGALMHPGDASLRPDRYVEALRAAVVGLGGRIEEGVTVTGLEAMDAQTAAVSTAAGRRAAREIVLASGAWSRPLARSLGLHLPVEPGKGYSITCARPAQAPRIPVVLKERSVCVTSWGDSLRLGSTMEFSGYDTSLNRVRLDALRRALPEYLAIGNVASVREEWWGWRPMTPDDLPLLGRARRWRNLVIATGHGMLGITLSAITGLLVGEIIAGRAPSVDLAPLAPERFSAR